MSHLLNYELTEGDIRSKDDCEAPQVGVAHLTVGALMNSRLRQAEKSLTLRRKSGSGLLRDPASARALVVPGPIIEMYAIYSIYRSQSVAVKPLESPNEIQ